MFCTNIDGQGALRQQVESELNTAEGRIEAISHRLEHRESVIFRSLLSVLIECSRKTVERWTKEVHQPCFVHPVKLIVSKMISAPFSSRPGDMSRR